MKDDDIIIIRDSDGEASHERKGKRDTDTDGKKSGIARKAREMIVELDMDGNEIIPPEQDPAKTDEERQAVVSLNDEEEITGEDGLGRGMSGAEQTANASPGLNQDSGPFRNGAESSGDSLITGSFATDRGNRERKPRIRAISIFGGDKVLWTIITALLIISVLVSYSATVYKGGGTPASNLVRQFIFIGVGIGSLLLVHFIRYQFYGKVAGKIFLLGLVLTAAAVFIGTEAESGMGGAGASRDIRIPYIGISFQPFEILKIGLIMLLAKRLAGRQKNIDDKPVLPSFRPSDWRTETGRKRNSEIIRTQTLPLLTPIFLACIVSYVAVGNSTTLIMAATCFIMFYIGRVRRADLGKMLSLAAIAAIVLFASGVGRDATGKSRIASFKPDMLAKHVRLNADSVEVYDYPAMVTPSGKVIPAESDQSISAKMSIASGKVFGKGPGMSTHRSNLSEAEKDFVYAFIIEEYGAVGGVLILLLYLWLFFRTIVIFKKCGTAFPSLLVLGLGLMIIFQAMIHMLVSVALFPITGQQLPLISKGGSSLVFTLMALGMILGVSRQTENKTLDNPKGESLFENK